MSLKLCGGQCNVPQHGIAWLTANQCRWDVSGCEESLLGEGRPLKRHKPANANAQMLADGFNAAGSLGLAKYARSLDAAAAEC
jgi:hypothetical protein